MGTVISMLREGLQLPDRPETFPILDSWGAAIYIRHAMSKDKDPKDAGEPRIFDSRIVERNVKRGVISRKDYEKFLKGLPDLKDKVKPSSD
jgi:hypothetical protein